MSRWKKVWGFSRKQPEDLERKEKLEHEKKVHEFGSIRQNMARVRPTVGCGKDQLQMLELQGNQSRLLMLNLNFFSPPAIHSPEAVPGLRWAWPGRGAFRGSVGRVMPEPMKESLPSCTGKGGLIGLFFVAGRAVFRGGRRMTVSDR